MRVLHIEEKVSTRNPIRLHHITDTHVGAPDLAEEELKYRIQLIKQDPYARWTMGGDGGELISHNDRRYEPAGIAPRYRQATDIRLATQEHLLELFEPIWDKLWAWGDGNHEHAMDKHFGGHFSPELLAQVKQHYKYAEERSFVHITFKVTKTQKLTQVIDLQHGQGRGGGRTKSTFALWAEREMSYTTADILLRGHTHNPNEHTWIAHSVSRSDLMPRRIPRTAINGGCWKLGYAENTAPVNARKLSETEKSIWAERRGFRPERIGGSVLCLWFKMGSGPVVRNTDPSKPSTRSKHGEVRHSVIQGDITEETLGL